MKTKRSVNVWSFPFPKMLRRYKPLNMISGRLEREDIKIPAPTIRTSCPYCDNLPHTTTNLVVNLRKKKFSCSKCGIEGKLEGLTLMLKAKKKRVEEGGP